MELQLGLSLVPPSNSNNNSSSSSSSIEGFDLNHFANYEPNNMIITSPRHILITSDQYKNNKRVFSQAFSEKYCNSNANSSTIHDDQRQIIVPKTLPLLWNDTNNNQPNFGGDDNIENSSIDDEEEGVVGWPPLRSWRKKLCCEISTGRSDFGNRTVENGCRCGGRVSKFMYVKVKMEGVAIARKVDLSAHTCFQTLINTLMNMFGKYYEESENFKLTYQDREGDWLLAQDVSWRIFIRSVQRLKLVRRNR